MKSLSYPFLFSLLVFSFSGCGEEEPALPKEQSITEAQGIDDPSKPFDERLKNYVERKLATRPGENYRLKVYEEHLNDDGKKDIIITVNRLEHAIKSAEENNLVAKSQTLDFFGNHNYIIYYSSIKNTFSEPIIMGSTPKRELVITFENISSDKHKDLVVDYAIRNSQFRKFFLFIDDRPVYSFHWKLYDGWGTDQLESYCFKYGVGSYSEMKDIIINKGKMKNISPDDDYDAIEPKIDCTDTLVKRFFYNSKDGKYYTPN